jgi:hypothetical protein
MVADCLNRQYEDFVENPFFAFILQQLPAAFQSIKEYQSENAFCDDTATLSHGEYRKKNKCYRRV